MWELLKSLRERIGNFPLWRRLRFLPESLKCCDKKLLETTAAINSVLHFSGHDQELLLGVIEDYFDPREPDYCKENSTGMYK